MTQSAAPAPDQPPPLGPVLRHYGPWLGLAVAIAFGAIAYLDLRARVEALEAEPARTSDAGPHAEAEPLVTPSALDAGVEPELITQQGEPPEWPCAGSISAELVQVTVGRYGPAVLRCHAERAAQEPGLAGTLHLRLHVSADGHVDGAHLSGLDDDELIRCAGESALTWQFPPPTGGDCAVVDAPFLLGR